jgi:ubiquinone/menaquinone biosynthesis C-methylase UbiE
MDLPAFVLAHLPPPPARVLEVGCGSGELALALDTAGHTVTAIDPEAPEGPLFRRVAIGAFAEPGPFDAVVASRSLHHLPDLPAAVRKIARLLRPGGVLVLDDYGKERVNRRTAEWYYEQRLALEAAGGNAAPESFEACMREWEEDEADIHTYAAMRAELDRCFEELYFAWVPYLYRELEDVAPESLEQELADAGTIQATGFRYVGRPV